jgi:DNA recombination protein RmuC
VSSDLLVGVGLGLIVGLAVGVIFHMQNRTAMALREQVAQTRASELQQALTTTTGELRQTTEHFNQARIHIEKLTNEVEHLRSLAAERAAMQEENRQLVEGAFSEVSGKALTQYSEQFLMLADSRLKEAQAEATGELDQRRQAIAELLTPLQETLSRYEQGLRQLELDRKGAYERLTQQVLRLGTTQDQLQKETRNLVTALRAPQTRGRWGEIQLRRVVEMAGMVAHCDFDEQVSVETDSGRMRPDLVVHLPGDAQVVVDAKVPLEAFLAAVEDDEEEDRKAHLLTHARHLRAHVDQLAKKEYWTQFDPSPEFVVAFIPGDALLAAAYENDPALMEYAMVNRVLLTTPTTLIALLRTVAFGWQQEDIAQNAREVQQLGSELYERLRVLGSHFAKLHRNISGTVEAFNEVVGSIESRVMVTARRFPSLGVVGAGAKEIPDIAPVAGVPRIPSSSELATSTSGVHELETREEPRGDNPTRSDRAT